MSNYFIHYKQLSNIIFTYSEKWKDNLPEGWYVLENEAVITTSLEEQYLIDKVYNIEDMYIGTVVNIYLKYEGEEPTVNCILFETYSEAIQSAYYAIPYSNPEITPEYYMDGK